LLVSTEQIHTQERILALIFALLRRGFVQLHQVCPSHHVVAHKLGLQIAQVPTAEIGRCGTLFEWQNILLFFSLCFDPRYAVKHAVGRILGSCAKTLFFGSTIDHFEHLQQILSI